MYMYDPQKQKTERQMKKKGLLINVFVNRAACTAQ